MADELNKTDIRIVHRGTDRGEAEFGVVIPEKVCTIITPSDIHEAIVKLFCEKGLL